MTIEESFNHYYEVVKQTATDALNGDCGRNFDAMTKDKQKDTFIKVAFAAAAAGIVCGLICGAGGILSGVVSSVLVAGVVGSYMFCYLTNNEHCNVYEQVKDGIKAGAKIAKNEATAMKNDVASGWNNFTKNLFGK